VFEAIKMQYLIIAGPQAAGKTTTKRYLEGKCIEEGNKNFKFLDESRDIISKKHSSFGTLTLTRDLEYKIIEEDLSRLKGIEEREKDKDITYVDETSIFSLAHSSLHSIKIKDYFKEYMDILRKMNSRVIFLDIPPEISLSRRKSRYEKRFASMGEDENKDAIGEVWKYFNGVYPELLKMFEQINLPKIKIYNG
jgi:thymidylate kinase